MNLSNPFKAIQVAGHHCLLWERLPEFNYVLHEENVVMHIPQRPVRFAFLLYIYLARACAITHPLASLVHHIHLGGFYC